LQSALVAVVITAITYQQQQLQAAAAAAAGRLSTDRPARCVVTDPRRVVATRRRR